MKLVVIWQAANIQGKEKSIVQSQFRL